MSYTSMLEACYLAPTTNLLLPPSLRPPCGSYSLSSSCLPSNSSCLPTHSCPPCCPPSNSYPLSIPLLSAIQLLPSSYILLSSVWPISTFCSLSLYMGFFSSRLVIAVEMARMEAGSSGKVGLSGKVVLVPATRVLGSCDQRWYRQGGFEMLPSRRVSSMWILRRAIKESTGS